MTVQGDKTAVLQQDCPATTVQQPLHVLQCRSDSMAVLHWRISCGIAVAGAGQEQRSRSSNTPPTVPCACKLLTAHRPACPCTILAAAALSYLNPAVFTARNVSPVKTQDRRSWVHRSWDECLVGSKIQSPERVSLGSSGWVLISVVALYSSSLSEFGLQRTAR